MSGRSLPRTNTALRRRLSSVSTCSNREDTECSIVFNRRWTCSMSPRIAVIAASKALFVTISARMEVTSSRNFSTLLAIKPIRLSFDSALIRMLSL